MDERSSGGGRQAGRSGRSAGKRRKGDGGALIGSSALLFLEAALERAGARPSVISVPAPCRPVAAALGALRRPALSSTMAWLPPSGVGLVGIGAAATLTGPVTSAAVRRRARRARSVESGRPRWKKRRT